MKILLRTSSNNNKRAKEKIVEDGFFFLLRFFFGGGRDNFGFFLYETLMQLLSRVFIRLDYECFSYQDISVRS